MSLQVAVRKWDLTKSEREGEINFFALVKQHEASLELICHDGLLVWLLTVVASSHL